MKKLKLIILLAAFMAVMQHAARTAPVPVTPALSFTGGSFFGATAGTFGWAFTLSGTITVNDLGYFDFGDNGLAASHDVGIWSSDGTLLVTATVPAGTAGTLIGDFRYTFITPTLLPAGDYVIGGFESGSSGDPVVVAAATITPAAGITYGGSRSVAGAALTFPPGNASGFGNSYFGPNFLFSVPEPASTGLLLFGSAAASVLTWLRRRRQGR
jgi:PEP-CTERM motif-containing protein